MSKHISNDAMQAFMQGNTTKSRFKRVFYRIRQVSFFFCFCSNQKKEEAAKKEANDHAEAAKIYKEFVKSFEGDEPEENTFVRGGIQGSGRMHSDNFQGDEYTMKSSSSHHNKEYNAERDRISKEMGKLRSDNQMPSLTSKEVRGSSRRRFSSRREEKSIRNLDKGPPPSSSLPRGGPGSYSDHNLDGDSTNLFVCDISPTANEDDLMDVFSRFGRVFSIKIMWPRTDEEMVKR